MTIDHFREAERLLLSCQLEHATERDAATYPQYEDGVNSICNALTAAQVHATLALAEANRPRLTPGPCPASQEMTLTGVVHCGLRAGHDGDHEHGKPDDGNPYARWGS